MKIKTFVSTSALGEDANLNGTDRYVDLEMCASEVQLQLVAINLVAVLRQQLFVYKDLYKWLDDPSQRHRRWPVSTWPIAIGFLGRGLNLIWTAA